MVESVRDLEKLRRLFICENPESASALRQVVSTTGALLRGDFELSGGKFSRYFLRFGQITWNAAALDIVAFHLEQALSGSQEFECVKCCETAAYGLGKSLASRFGAALTVVKADSSRRPTTNVRRGNPDHTGATLIVSDIVTTGGSIQRLLEGVQNPVAIAAFAVASPERTLALEKQLRIPIVYLLAAGWDQHDAPVDAANVMPASEFN